MSSLEKYAHWFKSGIILPDETRSKMRSKTECIAWSVGMGNTMYTQWSQRTVGRAELKISERPLFPEDLQPTRRRSRPTAPRLRQTRPRARDCPSSSEDCVIAVINAGSATSRSVSFFVHKNCHCLIT